MMELIILAVMIGGVGFYVLAQYNSFVALRHHIRESWSNIDTELKRRYDLIPNLVSVVKGYAAHEKALLESVIERRNRAAANHGSVHSQCSDEKALVSEMRQLLAVVENYPQLKADRHFMKLQRELVNTEDRIQAARRFYNANIRDYRTKCEAFPTNLMAGMFGFGPEEYFTVEPVVREAVPTQIPDQEN